MGPADRLAEPCPAGTRSAISQQNVTPASLTLETATADETQRIGKAIGRLLEPGDLLLLQGPIGAGKTCFTQGVARGLGLAGWVTSPSFTLANVYEPSPGRFPLYHLDLWRIKSPLEALGMGLDEYLAGDGAVVIEWPDVAVDLMPSDFLRVRFRVVDDGRQLELCPVGARPRDLLDRLRESLAGPSAISGGAGAARR
jgi:tRNA threonylcarbamoyladenosine biosynthesis protein TsaE